MVIGMSTQNKFHSTRLSDQVPFASNVGLIAGLVTATVGFIAIFVYYL